VLFRQFVDDDLGCGSYLIGDTEAGEAVLVDPPFAVEPLLEAAAEAGVRVVRVLETHTHADHVSGHGRLALEHGVPVSIHPLAEPEYPFDPLADGDVLEVGDVRIETIHTPGHRPEHCSFLVDGKIALTGDSLFVGDAARPDLAVAAREGARALFGSLRRLAELPDDVEVYPGHVAGSLCGGGMRPDRSSTIGRERADNQALAYEELQDFVLASASVAAPRPPTTERVVALNRGPWLPLPLAPEPVPEPGDATVLDVRPLADHVAGHIPGAISVPLNGGSFGTKAGFVLDPDEPLVLHAGRTADALAAARKLWAVGILSVAGYVVAAATPEPLATLEVDELRRLLDTEPEAVQLLDVREASERDTGYLPGSRSIPYRLLRGAGAEALDATRPVVTICESGARAAIAASLLQRAGYDVRAVVDGGVRDFDGDVVSFRRCGGG
jgi:glyoxylase-like metal-dependent hydrolase (beta-lactamase superfamily II)/rhodanese-related sulfurtransferase